MLLDTRLLCVCMTLAGWIDTAGPGRCTNTGHSDGVAVSATMHDKFQQLPINSGWCLSSVHRQSGGYCRYATETGTHSVNCAFLDQLLTCPLCMSKSLTCHGAEVVSLGPVQQTTEILQLHSIDQVFDVLVAQVQHIFGCRR